MKFRDYVLNESSDHEDEEKDNWLETLEQELTKNFGKPRPPSADFYTDTWSIDKRPSSKDAIIVQLNEDRDVEILKRSVDAEISDNEPVDEVWNQVEKFKQYTPIPEIINKIITYKRNT